MRFVVDKINLDIKLTLMNDSTNAIHLLAILCSEYLVIFIEEILGSNL